MNTTKLVGAYGAAWESNAQEDALYAILTTNRNSWNKEKFFAAGEEEIGRVFDFMRVQGIAPRQHKKFLDFGCGVGRNSRALIKRFEVGYGVDISAKMIEGAEHYAAADPCRSIYLVNKKDDLSQIACGEIDFVYSHIVLQHIPASLQSRYITEFFRILTPGGVAAFQIPTGWKARTLLDVVKRSLPSHPKQILRRLVGDPLAIEMHIKSAAEIARLCAQSGVRILAAPFTNSADPDHEGRVEFMDRARAIGRIMGRETDTTYLSQWFFVTRD